MEILPIRRDLTSGHLWPSETSSLRSYSKRFISFLWQKTTNRMIEKENQREHVLRESTEIRSMYILIVVRADYV